MLVDGGIEKVYTDEEPLEDIALVRLWCRFQVWVVGICERRIVYVMSLCLIDKTIG
jgi:hypothetical protein